VPQQNESARCDDSPNAADTIIDNETPVQTASKVASVTLAFWIMKICATTLGETGGDQLSMTMHVGYALSTVILLGLFLLTLGMQLTARRFHPALY
jgi:uncharacterized membrane-anchored protein